MLRLDRRRGGSWLAGVTFALLAMLAPGFTNGEPAVERTVVRTVTDSGRVLVRWQQVEGIQKRFTHYDVLRRGAEAESFVPLNIDPIGAAVSAAQIEAIFTAAGREDALQGILDSLGTDYAADLLGMQAPDAGDDAQAQFQLLPDLNYGAALTFGLGWLDETVVNGTTYVYEVWGLDPQGFRVERLGRASATAGFPLALAQVSEMNCVDPGATLGDMAAHLRWNADGLQDGNVAGFDVFRVPRNPPPASDCPSVEPGQPGVVRVNHYPTLSDAPGRVRAGRALFDTYCGSCHTTTGGQDPRDEPPSDTLPDNGVKGSTIASYRRTLFPDVLGGPHDHQVPPPPGEPSWLDLSTDSVQAIYDYIHEFEYRDDGTNTQGDPLQEGAWYCYEVRPRNLLGDHGAPVTRDQVICRVLDRRPPPPPYGMRAERNPQEAVEYCDISWERNNAPDEDTVEYKLYRMPQVPRLSREAPGPGDPALATLPQPVSGERMGFTDTTLATPDMGESFFYAARALDDAQNFSGFSAWVPCVPRDIVAPPAPTLAPMCLFDCGCNPLGADGDWLAAGGDPDVSMGTNGSDRLCPHLRCVHDGDAIGCRLHRSFDDLTYHPGVDFSGLSPVDLAIDHQPLIDQQIWFKAQAYDPSGNRSPFSVGEKLLIQGANPLPAPQIISVTSVNSAGRIKIHFRSLQPDRLLGFVLYRRYDDTDPAAADRVVRFHDNNLGNVYQQGPPVWWAKKSGAVTLSQISGFIRTTDPLDAEFLYYNDLDKVYVMQTDVGTIEDLVLHLRAVGWTGKEGASDPYTWGGWEAHDGVLDWPQFRVGNTAEGMQNDTLQVDYFSTFPARIVVSWVAWPDGNACPESDRLFIVYRLRGSGTGWKQLSPPFGCDSTSPTPGNLAYVDYDIQPGMTYTYRVIRLDNRGEFAHHYGPRGETVP